MAKRTGIEIELIELIYDWVIIDENISLQVLQLYKKLYILIVLKNVKK